MNWILGISRPKIADSSPPVIFLQGNLIDYVSNRCAFWSQYDRSRIPNPVASFMDPAPDPKKIADPEPHIRYTSSDRTEVAKEEALPGTHRNVYENKKLFFGWKSLFFPKNVFICCRITVLQPGNTFFLLQNIILPQKFILCFRRKHGETTIIFSGNSRESLDNFSISRERHFSVSCSCLLWISLRHRHFDQDTKMFLGLFVE